MIPINKIRQLAHGEKAKMLYAVISLWLCLGIGFLLVFYELYQSQEHILSLTCEQSQLLVDEMAEQLEEKIALGQGLGDLVKAIEENKITGSNRWQFLAYEQQVFFVKDVHYTKQNLKSAIHLQDFITQMEADGQLLIFNEFTDELQHYTYGLIIDKKSLLSIAQVSQQRESILIVVALMCLGGGSAVLALLIRVKQVKERKQYLENQLKETQLKLQQINQQEIIQQEALPTMRFKEDIYERGLFEVLLKKSDRKELGPVVIYYMKYHLSSRYYTKKELQELLAAASKNKGNKEIMLEIGKGEVGVLMYQTSIEEAMFVKNRIEKNITGLLKEKAIKLSSMMQEVHEGEKAYEIFMTMDQKMKAPKEEKREEREE